jgi:protein-tyrosine-phosphatase
MPSVLFVCTANRFRSPIAAALFRRSLLKNGSANDWQVGSAGTWAEPGLGVAPSVRWVIDHLGMDLQAHRARRIDYELLFHQDLILVMENSHREALQVEFPDLKERIYLLTNATIGMAYDVPDPGVAAGDTFLSIARELSELMDKGFQNIYQLASLTRM